MFRLVIIIAIAIAIVIAGLIIFIIFWKGDPSTQPVPVSINAVPWAKVFIKLPDGSDFIEPRAQDFTLQPDPNGKNANVTPIRGGLQVPAGTKIKLVYQDKEKIFPYEVWQVEKTISHDFLNQ